MNRSKKSATKGIRHRGTKVIRHKDREIRESPLYNAQTRRAARGEPAALSPVFMQCHGKIFVPPVASPAFPVPTDYSDRA